MIQEENAEEHTELVAGVLNPQGVIVAIIDKHYCEFVEKQYRFDLSDPSVVSDHFNR